MNKLKDIVPIQQERDLKELGFNFENEHCYLKQKLSLFEVEEPYGTFDLILFSQAFRWFRDKHGLVGLVRTFNSKNNFRYAVYAEYIGTEDYNTYEEAEQACLDKLIEIVKNGKHV